MSENEIIMTAEGLKKLEERLEHFKNYRRLEVAERIREAKEFGEIGENSEYEDAKTEQAFVEGEIGTLENMIRNARIVGSEEITTDVVSIGSRVKVKNVDTNEESEFLIIGSTESDPASGKISNKSPVGATLFGKKKGSTVEVHVPAGTIRYKIMKILKSH
jgi:transcription elongation factor GreA